ncbi:uncharacterized protein A4U43_C03F16610 [Asparagus officinalis]|uniref:BTB domain-containing protein n=1 Tax=Asparagus officinalis TaxID=4686 RepID=A0A5P1FAM3_ASPOF|nr:uncharacterized protein A4U43_C03F16610 [Asparagus officinalis]
MATAGDIEMPPAPVTPPTPTDGVNRSLANGNAAVGRWKQEWSCGDEMSLETGAELRSCGAAEKTTKPARFLLVSMSGKIRKLISASSRDSKPTRITIQNMPGGPESFELAAKFCYGLNIDLTVANAATLRCAAHHL